ncbi:hypothetical protein F5X99DRAFT_107358 [Biscogniauxia marginata]|nr:hypothetical protein F5X99DRAFT_107358 [Biscogniauxia marginata]
MGSTSNYRGDGQGQGPFNVKRIAIVGAGPCGISAAKYLLAEEAFERIDIYEQAAEVGGVWNYSAQPSGTLRVPQTDAFAPADEPVYPDPGAGGGKGTRAPLFPTPMYDDLHTNIPHTLMQYSDLDFPAGCKIFPSREVVQEYLVEYAKDVRHLIKFSTQVEDIALRTVSVAGAGADAAESRTQDQWDVRSKDLLSGATTLQTYDAVVVASGHYSTPYIPDSDPVSNSMVDIRAFHEAHPGVISHSKLYRNAEPYRGKKVVVVGTGPSGLDIAGQIQTACEGPLLVSAKTGAPPEVLDHLHVEQVGEIARFLVRERGVVFRTLDGSGDKGERVETDVDAVLFCTGFLYTFPFLTALDDPPLVTDGRRVRGLSKHFLHIAHPTLAFPGLPMKIIPFPLSESQAAVFARLWSNALPLPPRDVLEEWERGAGGGEGEDGDRDGKGYHVFPKGSDGQYINELHDWAMQARRGEGRGKGKEPPVWGDELLWQRAIFAEAKMQFEKTGRQAKTLEELGFVYEGKSPVKSPEDVQDRDPQIDVAG